jgi:hypothetical protein
MPLSVCNGLLRQNQLLIWEQYIPVVKHTEQAGAIIYTSNLTTSNICENDAPGATYLDMYF